MSGKKKKSICINFYIKGENFKCRGEASGAAVKDVRAQMWSKWTQEKWEAERVRGTRCVWGRVRLFTAGHNHQVSITSCPRYRAHPVEAAVMCEANMARHSSITFRVHNNVDDTDTPDTSPGKIRSAIVPSRRYLKDGAALEHQGCFSSQCTVFCTFLRDNQPLNWAL